MSSTPSITNPEIAAGGYRAAEASVRPKPIYTNGKLGAYTFDLRNCVFTLALSCPATEAPAARDPKPKASTHDDASETQPDEGAPTEIFLPEFHFPRDRAQVEVSSGRFSIGIDRADCGLGLVQRLRWWHGAGEQNIKITGIKRRLGVAMGKEEEEEGYLDQCRQTACTTM